MQTLPRFYTLKVRTGQRCNKWLAPHAQAMSHPLTLHMGDEATLRSITTAKYAIRRTFSFGSFFFACCHFLSRKIIFEKDLGRGPLFDFLPVGPVLPWTNSARESRLLAPGCLIQAGDLCPGAGYRSQMQAIMQDGHEGLSTELRWKRLGSES